jgi:hypothetical protein
MKLSVSLQLLGLRQSVGLLGRVICSSQGLYLYTNTQKRTHSSNTKHLCQRRDSNPRSQRPNKRKQFMPQTAQLPWPAIYLFYSIQMSWICCQSRCFRCLPEIRSSIHYRARQGRAVVCVVNHRPTIKQSRVQNPCVICSIICSAVLTISSWFPLLH